MIELAVVIYACITIIALYRTAAQADANHHGRGPSRRPTPKQRARILYETGDATDWPWESLSLEERASCITEAQDRDIDNALIDWQQAERLLAECEPGTPEEAEARIVAEHFQAEYERVAEAVTAQQN